MLLGLAWRAGTLGTVRGGVALDRDLRGRRDLDPLPAHRVRRAARRLVAGGDHHRRRAADRGAARVPRSRRPSACRARSVGLLVGFAGVVTLVGIDVTGQLRRAARRPGHPLRRGRLRGRPDDPARATRRARRARHDGREPRVAAVLLTPFAMPRPARRDPPTGSASPSIVVLGLLCTAAGVHHLQRPRGRGRPWARRRHHLRRARRGARTGRRGARRAPRTRARSWGCC